MLGAHQRYFILSRRRDSGLLFVCSLSLGTGSTGRLDRVDVGRTQPAVTLGSKQHPFLIFPWVNIRNLAQKSAACAARRTRTDWRRRYGYQLVLLETFVDGDRYHGTCYQAANWIYLGETIGKRRMDRYKEYPSTPKHIYVYPLVHDFRAYLFSQQEASKKGGCLPTNKRKPLPKPGRTPENAARTEGGMVGPAPAAGRKGIRPRRKALLPNKKSRWEPVAEEQAARRQVVEEKLKVYQYPLTKLLKRGMP